MTDLERNWTQSEVSDLFQQIFAKSLKETGLNEVFSAEWDSYRKVREFGES